jgi:DNA-directed RNA polymerase specialized sigma24 family protein
MPDAPDRHRFATTRWSLVLALRDRSAPDAAAALATLCETYWYPVYAFIRRTGKSTDDARDLTQAFFTRVIEKDYFSQARQERGRFRSFLLTSVRHFLSNQQDWDRAEKRGGRTPHLSLEFDSGERMYQIEPVEHTTPESLYERRWALAVLDNAMAQVRAKYEGSGRGDLFLHLQPFLTGDDPGSYADLAAKVGSTEGALRVAVHRMRQQFGAALREAIAETVEDPGEVEAELRHLLATVSK